MESILTNDIEYIHSECSNCSFEGGRILITGCAGFLGYYLTNYFVLKGEELGLKAVIGIDNFILDQKPDWIQKLENAILENVFFGAF